MDTAASFLRLLALPAIRAYEAFRDAVDATIHFFLDVHEADRARYATNDVTLWHKWKTDWPVKTLEGERDCYVWRRRTPDGKWEYRQREMTEEEKEERAEL